MNGAGRFFSRLLILLRPTAGYLPFLFAALALTSGTLGHWLDIDRHTMWSDGVDAFLGAARYLAFDGFQAPMESCGAAGTACEPTRGAIWIRFSQVFAVLFVVATADQVLRVVSGQYNSLRFNARARHTSGIDLVIGMGWHGTTLVEATAKTRSDTDEPQRTLCVDKSASPRAREVCRTVNIPLIEVDADTEDWLRDVPMKNVGRVFLSTGSDETNAAVLRRFAQRVQSAVMVNRLRCFVSVDDFRSFNALVDDQARLSLDIRPFNDATSTARLLYLQRAECYSFPTSTRSSRWVIWGSGAMSDAMLLQCLQNHVVEPEHQVQIDIVVPDAGAAATRWVGLYPCYGIKSCDPRSGMTVLQPDEVWLEEKVLPGLRFHQMPVSARGQLEWMEGYLDGSDRKLAQITVALAFDDLADTVNVARLIKPVLSDRIRSDQIPSGSGNRAGIGLWVYLNTQERLFYASLESSLKDDVLPVVVFRDHLGDYSKTRIDHNVVERAGMWTHAAYSDALAVPAPVVEAIWYGGFGTNGDGQLKPPPDEWARESSRLAGAHAWVKRGIRQRLVEAGLTDEVAIEQELAKVEHRRWCAVHLLDGWRSLVDPTRLVWSDAEAQLVTKWYSGKKQQLRQQRKHLCLMPFTRFDLLESVGYEGLSNALRERTKDLGIVRATEQIVSVAQRQLMPV